MAKYDFNILVEYPKLEKYDTIVNIPMYLDEGLWQRNPSHFVWGLSTPVEITPIKGLIQLTVGYLEVVKGLCI